MKWVEVGKLEKINEKNRPLILGTWRRGPVIMTLFIFKFRINVIKTVGSVFFIGNITIDVDY